MRKLVILGLIFLLMSGLQFLQVGVETTLNPLSLATFGFVLLAAYTLGEIAGNFGLPRITGFIVTGVVFGPYVVNLFSLGVVEDLKGINSLAIGLIAVTAGGEMKISSLKSVARNIGYIMLFKGILVISAIMLTVLAIAPMVPFLSASSTALILAVGAIFGILAFGTSPAVTIAVINETSAKGRLTDTTLGTAVAKDIVMVVLLALAIAFAQLYSTAGASFDPGVLATVGAELFFSLLAGAVLGGIIIAYIRYVHAEMWLFIIAFIYTATAIAGILHLEALLMFITAGFVVQNFSEYGEELIHPIEKVALPVYVVFFSIAGAGLDLGALLNVWDIALIMVTVRALAIYLGVRVATSVAKEPEPIRKNAWLSFISQAGVVLGLSIIVENNLPGLGADIKTVVIATIAMNLMIGPVLFKMALSRASEAGARGQQDEADKVEPEEIQHIEDNNRSTPTLPSQEMQKFAEPAFDDPRLNQILSGFRAKLSDLLVEFEQGVLQPECDRLKQVMQEIDSISGKALEKLENDLLDDTKADEIVRGGKVHASRIALSRTFLSATAKIAASRNKLSQQRTAFGELLSSIKNEVEGLDSTLEVDEEKSLLEPRRDDSLSVQFRKVLKRAGLRIRQVFGSGEQRTRTVYLHKLAKFHFVGKAPEPLKVPANILAGFGNFALQKCKIYYGLLEEKYDVLLHHIYFPEQNNTDDLRPAPSAVRIREELTEEIAHIQNDLEAYRQDTKARLLFAMTQTYQALLNDVRLSGTFQLPQRNFRFSTVYEASERAKNDIAACFEVWADYEKGLIGNIEKQIHEVTLIDEISAAVDEIIYHRSRKIIENLLLTIRQSIEKCQASRSNLGKIFQQNTQGDELKKQLVSERDDVLKALRTEALRKLERTRRSREISAFVDVLLRKFATITKSLPEECLLIDDAHIPTRAQEGMMLADAQLKRAPMRSIAQSYLETELVRDLADINRMFIEHFDVAIHTFEEIQQIIRFNMDAAVEELDHSGEESEPQNHERASEIAQSSLERAAVRLSALQSELQKLEEKIYASSTAQLEEKIERLDAVISANATLVSKMQMQKRKATAIWQTAFSQARSWISRHLKRIQRYIAVRYQPFAREAVRDLRESLGLKEYTPAEILAAYDKAKLDSEVLDSLPFIYQRLFDIAPLDSVDFLIAREDEVASLEQAKDRWLQGLHSSVAIIGEPGSGKTSFINAMETTVLRDCRIFRMNFEQTYTEINSLAQALSPLFGKKSLKTFTDLEARITKLPSKSVVILEDAHNLFLREVGGFDAMQKLMLLIARTSDQVFWICSIREFAWRYLDHVLDISANFPVVINTENLTREELEQVVLARNKVSGFSLRFLPGDVLKQRRKYRNASPQSQAEMAQHAYFNALQDVTDGNILSAIFYWLKSIRKVHEDELVIEPVSELKLHFLQGLHIDKLLTMAMIIQHGSLSSDEHARIFGCNQQNSQTLLTQLANVNLLARELEENGATKFSINRLIYKPLAHQLQAMHVLQD